MKKFTILFLLTSFLFGCITQKKESINLPASKKEVNIFLENWHKAAADANFDNYFNALDSTSIYIGTAAEEIWTKEQFASFSKPYFDKGKAWDFKTLDRTIYINNSGDLAWFNELLNTWMGTCRGSGVLEKINNTWKIKQYVLSVPIPNNDIQTVIKAKQKNDSIFLQNLKNSPN